MYTVIPVYPRNFVMGGVGVGSNHNVQSSQRLRQEVKKMTDQSDGTVPENLVQSWAVRCRPLDRQH